MIQVAVTIEERAVLASGTVRNRIRMCGKPAVPNTRAMLSEITSRPAIRVLGGGGTRASLPMSFSTAANSASGLNP